MECKFKENHYKKNRDFEAKLNQLKSSQITNDMDSIKEATLPIKNCNVLLLKKNNDIILPCKNESLHIRTQSQLNAMTIFDSILKKHNKIKFLIIQSYTIDDKSIQKLYDNIKNGKIETLQIILTETLSFRSPSHYKKIKDIFINEKNVNLVFYWIHSKVHLVETESDKYVVDGSGNFSMNAQIEHYNIFNSDELFDFDYKWQNDFFFGEKLRKNHEIYKNF